MLKLEVLNMNPFTNNINIHVPNKGATRVPESCPDGNEQENSKSSQWNGISVKEATQNNYLVHSNDNTDKGKHESKKNKTEVIDVPNLSTEESVIKLPGNMSKQPIEKNGEAGRWKDVSVKINTPKKYIPKKYQTPSNNKVSFLKYFSKFFSFINTKFYYRYKGVNKLSESIKYNNVVEFKKILNNMKVELTNYNNDRIKKHLGSGQKSHHESLCNVTINNKPILYALAESGSPEIIEVLCTDNKMAPRGCYVEPVRDENDTVIANTIIEGELNKKDWWCYSGSPVKYALELGNIDAAKVFISYDANIQNCKTLLAKIPGEIRIELLEILQKRYSILLSHMESQTNVVDILEKITETNKLDSGLKVNILNKKKQLEKDILIEQVESKLKGITQLMFKSEISKMNRAKNLNTFKNNLLQSLNLLHELIKRNIADQKMLQNMI